MPLVSTRDKSEVRTANRRRDARIAGISAAKNRVRESQANVNNARARVLNSQANQPRAAATRQTPTAPKTPAEIIAAGDIKYAGNRSEDKYERNSRGLTSGKYTKDYLAYSDAKNRAYYDQYDKDKTDTRARINKLLAQGATYDPNKNITTGSAFVDKGQSKLEDMRGQLQRAISSGKKGRYGEREQNLNNRLSAVTKGIESGRFKGRSFKFDSPQEINAMSAHDLHGLESTLSQQVGARTKLNVQMAANAKALEGMDSTDPQYPELMAHQIVLQKKASEANESPVTPKQPTMKETTPSKKLIDPQQFNTQLRADMGEIGPKAEEIASKAKEVEEETSIMDFEPESADDVVQWVARNPGLPFINIMARNKLINLRDAGKITQAVLDKFLPSFQ
ncbi:MAG: hypothetical protein GY820_38900 [Gammaproteobacteria bacterium]|nr:hypothetical protein [Gammaproteobacteria bacterium]